MAQGKLKDKMVPVLFCLFAKYLYQQFLLSKFRFMIFFDVLNEHKLCHWNLKSKGR